MVAAIKDCCGHYSIQTIPSITTSIDRCKRLYASDIVIIITKRDRGVYPMFTTSESDSVLWAFARREIMKYIDRKLLFTKFDNED